jgi:Cu/Ag efflux protein CusF
LEEAESGYLWPVPARLGGQSQGHCCKLGGRVTTYNRRRFHEADGQIVEINDKEVTLAHGPFKTLGMPGMTMTFPLATPALMQGLKTGDKVRIAVSQTDDGLRVERLERSGSQP